MHQYSPLGLKSRLTSVKILHHGYLRDALIYLNVKTQISFGEGVKADVGCV